MNRRTWLGGIAAAASLPQVNPGQIPPAAHSGSALLRPRRLTTGDTIGVIAPGSGVSAESFDRAVGKLEGMGFKVQAGRFARGNRGLFSGTESERLHDLHWAFATEEIRAVWCVRGGDGTPRILPEVDFALIQRHPKILVGYSDITALHVALHQRCGLVTFHGPVGVSSFSDYSRQHVLNVLTNPTAPYPITVSAEQVAKPGELYRPAVITPGQARGRLVGGNLSLLTALAGTPWALADLAGKILFLEDIDEQPYRVDRMLTQLRQSADLRSLAGIALGVFEGCVATEKKPSPSVLEIIRDRLGDLGIPVIYGLSFGHVRDQFTLPIGIEAGLDTESATLTLLEPAVV